MLQASHYGMSCSADNALYSVSLRCSHILVSLADSGKVCMGPVGAPVSGRDRQMLLVIQELEPILMGNWYVGPVHHGYPVPYT